MPLLVLRGGTVLYCVLYNNSTNTTNLKEKKSEIIEIILRIPMAFKQNIDAAIDR
jgi:hypothetical protein